MAIPFDFQKFSSEIITGVAVFIATQLPKGWRWAVGRVRPDPQFPALLTAIIRASLRVESLAEGTCQVTLYVTNLSNRAIVLDHAQVDSFEFDNTVMPQPDAKITPVRIEIPSHNTSQATVGIRMHEADIKRIAGAAFRAPNIFSSPGHRFRIAFSAVVRRWPFNAVLEPRFLEAPIEVTLPESAIPSPATAGNR